MIQPSIEAELHAYIGGICNNLGCPAIIVGGYVEHIHILCMLSRKIALMELVAEIKGASSRWIKSKGTAFENFYWQDGYATFSVNPAQVGIVERYIANQHAHHSKITHSDELRSLFRKYKVDYDEKYVWD